MSASFLGNVARTLSYIIDDPKVKIRAIVVILVLETIPQAHIPILFAFHCYFPKVRSSENSIDANGHWRKNLRQLRIFLVSKGLRLA